MEETLDKSKVNKDLEAWATKIVDADKILREVYNEISKVYNKINEVKEVK